MNASEKPYELYIKLRFGMHDHMFLRRRVQHLPTPLNSEV